MSNNENCPCGSQEKYQACCGRFHQGLSTATTAEQLMRSRYSAFCKNEVTYLVSTHHSSSRTVTLEESLNSTIKKTQWMGLRIIDTVLGMETDSTGIVEFIAFYHDLENGELHERSRFVKEGEQWFYVDTEPIEEKILGRNDPCWCGSGKKFKKCHGKRT